jgi:hypothetical protein
MSPSSSDVFWLHNLSNAEVGHTILLGQLADAGTSLMNLSRHYLKAKMTHYCFFSSLTHAILYDTCPCGFGVRQRFQKNKPHPPEPAVGNNTGTNSPNPHAIRSAGFSLLDIPRSICIFGLARFLDWQSVFLRPRRRFRHAIHKVR